MSDDLSVEDGELVDSLNSDERETLRLALESGYFEVPRQISTVELANEVGVDDREVIEHSRRGIAKLLRATELNDGKNEPEG